MDGERMDAAFQLACQGRIDHAVAFEPALPAKGCRHDIEPVMGFAARPMPGMAFMQMGFILDMQTFGRKSGKQFRGDDILYTHAALP